jgi:hypothetical protein
MRKIQTEIEINAPAEQVWQVLTDFAAMSEWNPFIRRISGRPRVGERLRVHLQPPGGRGMTFRPVVLQAVPERELRWLGRLLVPGLFDGEHYFQIEPLDERRVRFVHGERFSGLVLPLLWRGLVTNTRRGFEEMNRALKARAERSRHQQ